MATLRVPDVVPSPVEDAEQLQKAFEGLLLITSSKTQTKLTQSLEQMKFDNLVFDMTLFSDVADHLKLV
ncbi:Annexin D3 [Prunus dulcis]|uniref:Annexin D3 n=1 Tax=Prunus dulcis TaxID=3755 RepID=A0A4Y1RPE2_PRUDU|nr:Annexin D3 [Prunus dulcis]